MTKAHPSGDQGGNDFIIQVSNARGGLTSEKLHSYWDGGIGDFPKGGPPPEFPPPPLTEIPPAVARLTLKFSDKDSAWKVGVPSDFNEWANESSKLAQTVAYTGIAANQQPSLVYNTAALAKAQQQVVWGGYRLASLLNSIWPETAPANPPSAKSTDKKTTAAGKTAKSTGNNK